MELVRVGGGKGEKEEGSPCGEEWETHRTILSSFNSLSRDISRMAVLGTPSSSASSLIFFKATTSPELMSFALYTTPYVPERDNPHVSEGEHVLQA